MANRHGPAQSIQDVLMEHIPHQPQVFMIGQLPVVDGGDAAGLLPPVLEGVKPVIGGPCAVSGRVIDAKDAAFFMNGHGFPPFPME